MIDPIKRRWASFIAIPPESGRDSDLLVNKLSADLSTLFEEIDRLTRERDDAREALHDFLPRIEATEKTSRLLYRTMEGLKVERDAARAALRDLVNSTSWIGERCVIDQSPVVGSGGALDRAMQKLVEWERE